MPKEPDGLEITAKMKQLEFLGHEVLAAKKTIVDLDRTMHQTREAWRAVRKQKELLESGEEAQEKVPLFVSPKMFVKVSTNEAEQKLKKGVDEIDKEMTNTRKELRQKVDDLRKFEGQKELKELGFDLKPVTDRFFVNSDLL